jgi:hypothetical protein
MNLQEQIRRIQEIIETQLKSGKEIFFPKTLQVLLKFFKIKKNPTTKEINFFYPNGDDVEIQIDKSKSGEGYQTIIIKNVPIDFIENDIIGETDDDDMVDYDQKKIFKIYKKLDLEQTIRRILREDLFNKSVKHKLEDLLDKKGLGETLNVLRIDIDKLSSMVGLSMEELLEKYNPFKDIFSDEEFDEKLIKTLTYIEINSDLREHFKKLTLEKKIVMVIGMIIDKLHSDLINWDVQPYDWKVPKTPELLSIIYKDSILDNNIFKRLLSYKNSKLNENDNKIKKDLSPILKNLLNKLLVKPNKDIICGVKVVHPSDRESVGIEYKNYEVILFFLGDDEEEMTYKERQKYNKLEDEAFDLIYKYTNQYADVYSKLLKSCDE